MFWPRPRRRVLPPIVHPTRYNERHFCCEYIVPEVHPSHTKNIMHHNYKHVHSYPHSESCANVVTHQHFQCGPRPPFPGRPSRPWF